MTVAAVSMFHNEEDVAGYVVRHMLGEVDQVIVADNRSTDQTRAILEAIDDPRLTVVDEPRFGYGQAETMARLAAMAAGAEWIVPFDADEWWFTPNVGVHRRRIADVLPGLPTGAISTAAQTWDMIPQPTDPEDPNPFSRIWCTRPGSMWSFPQHRKIAYRPGPGRLLVQGNHGLAGLPAPPLGPLRIRHYPFRSFEQARDKLRHGRAAIRAAGLPSQSGFHWQEWGAYSDARLEAWWADWTKPEGLVRWEP